MAGWDTFFPASGAEAFANFVMQAARVYPHQLFPRHPAVEGVDLCVLVEDPLFFRQYAFHRQKLVLHRASMRAHEAQLRSAGVPVDYLDSVAAPDMATAVRRILETRPETVHYVDPVDDWAERRLLRESAERFVRERYDFATRRPIAA